MMAITQDPQAQQVLQSVAIMNMEGEGLSDVRNFFRKKMVEAGVVQPTEEEMMQMQAAMANQQPDPNAVFLQSAAEEAMAKAAGARAGVVKTVADAELARAKTMSTLSSIDLDERAQLIKLLETLTAKDTNVAVTPVPPGLGSMSSEITQQVAGLPMDIQGEFIERLSNQ
jgi:predicted NAD/FAD-dependent oxidoreductase